MKRRQHEKLLKSLVVKIVIDARSPGLSKKSTRAEREYFRRHRSTVVAVVEETFRQIREAGL